MFGSAVSLNRTEVFRDLVRSADTVLRHSYVREALGSLVVELAEINDNVFLPDVTGGVIRIPEEQQESDSIAVVPLMYKVAPSKLLRPKRYQQKDGSLFTDASACRPTRSTGRRVLERLIGDGWDIDEARSFLEVSLLDPEPLTAVSLPSAGEASIHFMQADESDSATRLTSRPIILTNFMPGAYSPIERGLTMLHEYVHIQDFESTCTIPEDSMAALAATEARAYHMEVEARLALRAAGFKPRDTELEDLAFDVEYLRREHTSPDDPYGASPILVAGMEKLGVFDARLVRSYRGAAA